MKHNRSKITFAIFNTTNNFWWWRWKGLQKCEPLLYLETCWWHPIERSRFLFLFGACANPHEFSSHDFSVSAYGNNFAREGGLHSVMKTSRMEIKERPIGKYQSLFESIVAYGDGNENMGLPPSFVSFWKPKWWETNTKSSGRLKKILQVLLLFRWADLARRVLIVPHTIV